MELEEHYKLNIRRCQNWECEYLTEDNRCGNIISRNRIYREHPYAERVVNCPQEGEDFWKLLPDRKEEK